MSNSTISHFVGPKKRARWSFVDLLMVDCHFLFALCESKIVFDSTLSRIIASSSNVLDTRVPADSMMLRR